MKFFIGSFVTISKILAMILVLLGMRIIRVNPVAPRDRKLAKLFYELRDDVFAKKHHWEEPRGEERDRYDLASIFIVVMKGDRAVAGCRIIHKKLLLGNPLPMEEGLSQFEQIAIPRDAIEISRMINTSGSKLVFFALHLAVYTYAKTGGFRKVFATIRKVYLEERLDKIFGKEYFERLTATTIKRKGADQFIPVQIHLSH
ncbi:MAG: acyl-homoserine-lactone synthase [Candidatus Moranbacteria bacterium]|nr:acyl-homoserine-lactone synthase [Candidatus Moranbacteria bacterium]MDD3964853.1 acyl-homoserine-lactone synthase [Candidatus Moranbacteria bacterium]